jgi:cap2 methyltransferase
MCFYGKGVTKYLAGDVYLPVWGPITTTETRLVPSEGLYDYDNTKYEENMFYFNTAARVALYPHLVENQSSFPLPLFLDAYTQ